MLSSTPRHLPHLPPHLLQASQYSSSKRRFRVPARKLVYQVRPHLPHRRNKAIGDLTCIGSLAELYLPDDAVEVPRARQSASRLARSDRFREATKSAGRISAGLCTGARATDQGQQRQHKHPKRHHPEERTGMVTMPPMVGRDFGIFFVNRKSIW